VGWRAFGSILRGGRVGLGCRRGNTTADSPTLSAYQAWVCRQCRLTFTATNGCVSEPYCTTCFTFLTAAAAAIAAIAAAASANMLLRIDDIVSGISKRQGGGGGGGPSGPQMDDGENVDTEAMLPE